MDIIKLFNNDLSNMSYEDQKTALAFNDKLKYKIIDELVEYETKKLIKTINKSEDDFKDIVGNILINGTKGFNKIPVQSLINIYLEKIGQERFLTIIEQIY